jgi:hypothetical protein
VHRLHQLGTCYSLVDAAPDADAICDAVRNGRVTVHAEPLAMVRAGLTMADMFAAQLRRRPRTGLLRPASEEI